MSARDFIKAADAAIDLRGSQKESFVNHLIGMLEGAVMAKPNQTTSDLIRMVNSSVKFAKSIPNEN